MGKKSKKRRERARRREIGEVTLRQKIEAHVPPVIANDIRLLDRANREKEEKREHARADVAANPDRHLPFPPTWPEIAETEQAALPADIKPALGWHALEREAAQVRQYYIEHPEQWSTEREASPELYDVRNIQHFQALPTIQNYKKRCMQNAALQYGLIRKQPRELVEHIVNQIRAEQSHLLYHQAMWRGHGRRVYVLDRTTYELLAATPLPKLPASILSMPYHSFYLKLPEKCFQFEVQDTRTGQHDVAYVEGVAIAMDKIDPDYPGTRELALTVMGEWSPTVHDLVTGKDVPASDTLKGEARNTAFISIRLGPDAPLSDVHFDGGVRAHGTIGNFGANSFADPECQGSHELGTLVPRVVIGLLLYLASEHPDVQPVAPAPRRDVESFRNPAKRRKAEQANARAGTRLTMLYVGRNLHDEIEKEKETVRANLATAGRTLDHPVWVRGHWRLQPIGVGRMLRKTIWIRPYVKGPDVADSLAIRAAKIQRAEHVI